MDADKAAQQDDDDANQWERYPWAATAQQLRTHQFRYESSSDESDGDTVDEEAGAHEQEHERQQRQHDEHHLVVEGLLRFVVDALLLVDELLEPSPVTIFH